MLVYAPIFNYTLNLTPIYLREYTMYQGTHYAQ